MEGTGKEISNIMNTTGSRQGKGWGECRGPILLGLALLFSGVSGGQQGERQHIDNRGESHDAEIQSTNAIKKRGRDPQTGRQVRVMESNNYRIFSSFKSDPDGPTDCFSSIVLLRSVGKLWE